ncbi:unnamed protein product [Rotaria sp. Silwood1]|nr:unnamed protein product [Rotaria sp. Silwood1]CAF1310474.1 unnamed protein product [Rotaria sp. Silwood1]CAF4814289.1 unnamed protein product [Rotaria sp. Silwood1]
MIAHQTTQDNCLHFPRSSTSTTMMIESHSQLSTSSEMKPTKGQINASSETLPKYPVQFTAEDLRTHLEPIIQKMIVCEDSYPFRQPIDAMTIITKHPMDISTMHNKLLHGEYKNPLEFCDDAWLMFNNAWLYNKKTTPIYTMCTNLAKLFVEYFDPIIQALGYCCSRQYVYLPKVMLCYGKKQCCRISRDDNYYYYDNPEPSRFNLSNDIYTFCAECFHSIKCESILVGDDPTQTLVEIPKTLFISAKNDIQEPEIMIECIVCTRRWHQICALHLNEIWPEGFICNTCLRQYNIKRKENSYIAQKLTVTDLSSQLEQRVNTFLFDKNCYESRVTIRVLASSDNICKVKPQLKKYYPNQVTDDGYPYRTKAIFAFQEIEGVDVVFFGMYVQEYDEHCPAPNTRRVYISYLDTVHFFRPKLYRQDVYHEIVIGYLDYAKQLGYMYAHIWACPASENVDGIFYCHPPEQDLSKPKWLQDWCKKMLDRAIVEHIVIDYKDIMQDSLDNQVQSVLEIPYFDGDFWPITIEETIEKLGQEEDRRKQEVETAQAMEDEDFDDSIDPEEPTEISGKRKSANTYEKKNLKKMANQQKLAKNQMANCTNLLSIIFSTMETYKEAFFVIRLNNQIKSYPAVNDTDARIQCNLMDTRDVFLNFAYNNNYEFSSLRRAKFSTMVLLYELHVSTTEKFTYNCNRCQQLCDICYYCTVSEDFDLCEKFYNMQLKHEPNSLNNNYKSIASSQLQQIQSVQHCIEALLHAINCCTVNCVNRSCFRYKHILQHTKDCKEKNRQCNVCKQVIFLCRYHAKSCMDQNCQVPCCTYLKSEIQKQRVTCLQTDRRCMEVMMM